MRSDRDQKVPPTGVAPGTGEPLERKKRRQCPASQVACSQMEKEVMVIKEFSPEELARFNGQNGKPVYIAHGGKVIDVTASKLWKSGLHMKRHHAGKDLTTDIQAAPHSLEVLE